MRMFLVAGLLVTLPGIVVIFAFLNRPLWILPAVVSVGLNSLPFIVAIFLVRAQKRSGPKADFAEIEH